jgi:hypothetical protein
MAQKFALVEEADPVPAAPPKPDNSAAVAALVLGLKALGQRALIAISSLFCLITVLTVFFLAMNVIHEPTIPQLVGLGLYAAFVIAINLIVRRA